MPMNIREDAGLAADIIQHVERGHDGDLPELWLFPFQFSRPRIEPCKDFPSIPSAPASEIIKS
jgi:hypothetical protein